MYVSFMDELQRIRTLSEGIERMVTAAIATDTIPSLHSPWEERVREIRERLQSLSDDIAQSITRST